MTKTTWTPCPQAVPRWVSVYAAALLIFTGVMVTASLVASDKFFGAYGVSGDAPMQAAWSIRYAVIALMMLAGLVCARHWREPRFLLFAIGPRWLLDLGDAWAVFHFNTPPFSWGWLAFHLAALLGPQMLCLFLILRRPPLGAPQGN